MWGGGEHQEAELLGGAYVSSLELAVENGCESIALPALSTGAYGFPLDKAAQVALTAVARFLKEHGKPSLVRFVLWGDVAYTAFSDALVDIPN